MWALAGKCLSPGVALDLLSAAQLLAAQRGKSHVSVWVVARGNCEQRKPPPAQGVRSSRETFPGPSPRSPQLQGNTVVLSTKHEWLLAIYLANAFLSRNCSRLSILSGFQSALFVFSQVGDGGPLQAKRNSDFFSLFHWEVAFWLWFIFPFLRHSCFCIVFSSHCMLVGTQSSPDTYFYPSSLSSPSRLCCQYKAI